MLPTRTPETSRRAEILFLWLLIVYSITLLRVEFNLTCNRRRIQSVRAMSRLVIYCGARCNAVRV
jgi:hypothetical protein